MKHIGIGQGPKIGISVLAENDVLGLTLIVMALKRYPLNNDTRLVLISITVTSVGSV